MFLVAAKRLNLNFGWFVFVFLGGSFCFCFLDCLSRFCSLQWILFQYFKTKIFFSQLLSTFEIDIDFRISLKENTFVLITIYATDNLIQKHISPSGNFKSIGFFHLPIVLENFITFLFLNGELLTCTELCFIFVDQEKVVSKAF